MFSELALKQIVCVACRKSCPLSVLLLLVMGQLPFRGANRSIQLKRTVSFMVLRGGKEFDQSNHPKRVLVLGDSTGRSKGEHRFALNRTTMNMSMETLHCCRCNSSFTEVMRYKVAAREISSTRLICKICRFNQTMANSSAISHALMSIRRRCSNCSRWAVFGMYRPVDSTCTGDAFTNIRAGPAGAAGPRRCRKHRAPGDRDVVNRRCAAPEGCCRSYARSARARARTRRLGHPSDWDAGGDRVRAIPRVCAIFLRKFWERFRAREKAAQGGQRSRAHAARGGRRGAGRQPSFGDAGGGPATFCRAHRMPWHSQVRIRR